MKLVINEFIKVFGRKSMLFLIPAVLLLNGALLYVNEYNPVFSQRLYSPKAYKRICSDISGTSEQEALQQLRKKYDKLSLFCSISMADSSDLPAINRNSYQTEDMEELLQEYRAGGYLTYTDNLLRELYLYQDIISELEDCLGYEEYLNNIDDTAETISEISLFSAPASFSYRNIMQTQKAFSSLKNNELKFGPSYGVKMATESPATDLLAVLLIILIVILLMTREKEQSLLVLIKSTYSGRGRLAVSKLLMVYLCCIIIVILFYGSDFILAYHTYGFGDLNRHLQSVRGYIGSSLGISVWQYFLGFLAAKLMVYLLLASVVYLVAVISRDSLSFYLRLVIVFAAGAIAYEAIAPGSYLALLKYINPVAFLNTYQLFNQYLNINVFKIPVNYIPLFWISALVAGSLCSVLAILIFQKQKTLGRAGGKLFCRLPGFTDKKPIFFKGATLSVFRHECYKILIGEKALILLFLFTGFTFLTYVPLRESLRDINDLYYKQYMLKLEGEVNAGKLSFLKEEENRLTQAYDKMLSSISQGGDQTGLILQYQDILAPSTAFEAVKVHTEYLKNNKGYYLYDTGYKLLTGAASAGNKDLQLALTAIVMTIACLICVYSVEYQSGLHVILHTSVNGRGRTFLSKLLISCFMITLIYIITYAPYYYNVLHTYGTRAITAPANSMEQLAGLPGNITISGYLILISVMRYTGLLASGLVIFAISVKLKGYILSLVAAAGLLILPILLAMLGIPAARYVLLNPLLIGNVF